ncbi:HAD family hydrolase [Salinimicrobium flavum]|uniref:phosphoglycolate phosphatase n=1 Tax=Salinimicrobium flavum TaxID=1737065 RepID=A0ABW5IXY3_9FLAO
MTNIIDKKNILWDFDGVIMDSMPVRNRGFELVLKEYPKKQIEQLMDFHLKNGGLSRYVKFRYFFEEIRGEEINEDGVALWASRFSEVMKKELLNPALFIEDTLSYIKKKHQDFEMHIVSGSDQTELRYICEQLGLTKYFISINGSPTPKKELVRDLLNTYSYKQEETILIGDSINDYEAAITNGINFKGYNNPSLKNLDADYIEKFSHE